MNLLEDSPRRAHLLAFMAAIVFAISLASVAHATPASASSPGTGIIIPLYTYPGSTWNTVIQVKESNPSVNIVAVINPDNGPGASQDPNYVSGIQALRSAGVIVLGYVHTSYAARPTSAVVADINSYKDWYNVSGIFLDEMSNVAGNEAYYSYLNTYIKSLGYTMTVGNPGADTIPSYIGTVDVIVVYENAGLPQLSALGGWHSSYAKSNFASISYGVGSVNQTYIDSISNSVGYIYLTSGTLPNPYDSLPSYLGTLAAALSAQDNSNAQSQTTTTSSAVSTTVSSTNSSSTSSNTTASSMTTTVTAVPTNSTTVTSSGATSSVVTTAQTSSIVATSSSTSSPTTLTSPLATTISATTSSASSSTAPTGSSVPSATTTTSHSTAPDAVSAVKVLTAILNPIASGLLSLLNHLGRYLTRGLLTEIV